MIVIYAISSLLNTFSFGLLNKQLDFPILGEESLSYVIVMFTYFIAMTYFFSQTLGKMIMKIVFTNKKKGLHDFIADTVVVKEDFSKLRRQMNGKLDSKN